jgi:hypothetical protein
VTININSHIQSLSFAQAASRGSNVGLGIELGTAGLTYLVGCSGHRSSYAANTGFTALEAMGAANLMTLALKVGTNRQYAYHTSPHGEFWEGGRSFPSGHAATSFAFASVIAHRYPHNFWLKAAVYGLATGVSFARVAGKKHFASDILVRRYSRICDWNLLGKTIVSGTRESELDSRGILSFQRMPFFFPKADYMSHSAQYCYSN